MEIAILFIFGLFAVFCAGQDNYEIPLAPYNVKLTCRQGRRFSKEAQTPRQCPSSSTTCGFFELPMQDSKHEGVGKTGFYDCIDGGILQEDSGEVDDDTDDRLHRPAFEKMCGAVAQCTTMSIDTLNPAFVKYLVQEYDIKLEGLEMSEIRFCCALFHSTLQKLVTSPTYSLPKIATPPITCQGNVCDLGAVGCLLHAVHDEDDYENYDDKLRRVKRISWNDFIEDDEDYVDAVELSFDDLDIELITREPPPAEESTTTSTTSTTTTPAPTTTTIPTTSTIPLRSTLPSLRLPLFVEDTTSTTTSTTSSTSTTTTTTPRPVIKKPKPTKKVWQKPPADSYEDQEEGDSEPDQSTHCVYRHLNNEFYRYCLLVHQSRDGDRCYHHQGHTICCCFVAPDRETCDPTEMDLIVPPPPGEGAMPTRVVVTIPSTTTSIPSTTTTTTSTTTTTTTTTMPPIESTKYPSLPPQIYRYKPIDQTQSRKQKRKRCRVTYVRTKSGSRSRPVLVCDAANLFYLFTVFCSTLIFMILQVF